MLLHFYFLLLLAEEQYFIFFWDSSLYLFRFLHYISYVSYTLSCISHIFCLCDSFWIFPIDLFSRSWILYFAVSNLLLNSFVELLGLCIFCNYFVFLKNMTELTILTILSVQISRIKYIHTGVQSVSRTLFISAKLKFCVCDTITSYSTSTTSSSSWKPPFCFLPLWTWLS